MIGTSACFRCLRPLYLALIVSLFAVPCGNTVAQIVEAEAADPEVNTFSIVGFDPATGDVGVAVASKFLGVGSVVPYVKAGVGAVATQSNANPAYGPEGLELLASGKSAKEVVDALVAKDERPNSRQVGIVDAKGNTAAFSGPGCGVWAGHVTGHNWTAQGNLLAGEDVVKMMGAGFDEARKVEGSELADWLLAALKAGDDVGGDKRGKQSAALMVARAGGGYNGNDRYIDLRVEDLAEPIPELTRILEVHKVFFRAAHRRRPQVTAAVTPSQPQAPAQAQSQTQPQVQAQTQSPPTAAGTAGQRRGGGQAQRNYPEPVSGDFAIRDFKFNSGETLPELRIHYQTIGNPVRDASGKVRNAVLVLHGTTGSGSQFVGRTWANELYGPGQLLDASKHFMIHVDNIGHGRSSKPSDGLRAKFPKYGYRDMVVAQHRLLTEGLKVDHLRLVIGTSMGGMHSWLWGSMYPDYMDALMPLASLPTQISGRNRMWRRILIDAIKNSPDYNDGNYEKPPLGLRTAASMMYFMGDNTVRRQRQAPTLAEADTVFDRGVAGYLNGASYDANDVLYAFESSHDYDPGPGLEKIKAPLVAINFADDLINPPELGILEEAIKRVPRGKAITYPLSDETSGHGTHTNARIWKEHLETLLKETEQK